MPELHLGDDPEDARRSAWFHLRFAAAHGHATALLVCAKWHSGSGLTPSSNHYRGLLEAFKAAGAHAPRTNPAGRPAPFLGSVPLGVALESCRGMVTLHGTRRM